MSVALAWAAPPQDVILVGHPGRLVWYNTYQQRIPPDEVARFSSYTPLVLIHDRTLLGDGLTPCMQVDRNGTSLYILLDQSGTPAEQEGSAGLMYLKDVRLLGDSIVVRSRSGIIVHAADGKSVATVPPGKTLLRVFQQGERTYVQVPGRFPRFGWVTLNPPGPTTWEERRALRGGGRQRQPISAERLQVILDDANAALRNVHSHIVHTESSPQTAPWFTGSVSGDTIRCVLHPGSRARSYQESLRMLGEAITRMSAVPPFRIVVRDSVLLIPLQ